MEWNYLSIAKLQRLQPLKLMKWITNVMPHLTGRVITYPFQDSSWTMLVKRPLADFCFMIFWVDYSISLLYCNFQCVVLITKQLLTATKHMYIYIYIYLCKKCSCKCTIHLLWEHACRLWMFVSMHATSTLLWWWFLGTNSRRWITDSNEYNVPVWFRKSNICTIAMRSCDVM